MRPLSCYWIKVALLLLCLVATNRQRVAAMRQPDHLSPISFSDSHEKRFQEYLERRLGASPFDCGRYLVMPSFQKSEISVSLYSRRNGQGVHCYVTSIEAADNLRDWTEAGRFPDRATKVKVRRIDAEIPAATCALLKEVWLKMLSGRQQPRKAEYRTNVLWGDATMGEFSIKLSNGKILRGETELVPKLGKNTATFVEIGDALIEYCKASPAKRPATLAKTDEKGKKLLVSLNKNS